MSDETVPVVVIGGGPAGLATALLCARLGVRAAVVSPPPSVAVIDRRTAALFSGSIQLLRNLGVWRQLGPVSQQMSGIRLVDGRGGMLRAPETVFRADELGLDEFGFNVPNAALVAALTAAAAQEANLAVIPTSAAEIIAGAASVTIVTTDGRTIKAGIAVGADGRQSLVRNAAGIGTRTWDYPQAAVVASFTHQRPHHGISTEFHRAHGPLTTVPLPGRASSLVWVESRAEAARLSALGAQDFHDELEIGLNGLLGSVEEIGPRTTFPLSGLSADVLGRDRIALVGEAAHVIPPIGAQGLNLGLRDAAILAECIAAGRSDAVGAVAKYARARAPDVASRITAIDMLNRSLLSEFLPAHLLRGFGIYALGAISPLRRALVREGLQPSLATPKAMLPGGLGPSTPL